MKTAVVPCQGDGGDGSEGGGHPNDYPLKLKECRWKDRERGDGIMVMVGGARAGAREPQSKDDHYSCSRLLGCHCLMSPSLRLQDWETIAQKIMSSKV